MSKIADQAGFALINKDEFNKGNTTVIGNHDQSLVMRLHGNPIAKIDVNDDVYICDGGGYPTNVTAARLAGVVKHANCYQYVKRTQGRIILEDYSGNVTEIGKDWVKINE